MAVLFSRREHQVRHLYIRRQGDGVVTQTTGYQGKLSVSKKHKKEIYSSCQLTQEVKQELCH